MKLLYALFGYLVDCEKYEDNNKNSLFFKNSCSKEIFPEVIGRIKSLSEKEKKLELVQEIVDLYKALIAKYY